MVKGFQENDDIVQVDYYSLKAEISQASLHQALECNGGITHLIGHVIKLEQSQVCD